MSKRMPEKRKGRPSQKRGRLFKTYALLRCMMINIDVEELQRKYHEFRDMTPNDTDKDLQESIDAIVDAMTTTQPPNFSQAEPLRG